MVGENKKIVPRISQARHYSIKHAKTLAKRYAGGHAVNLENAVCVLATDSGQIASQRSYGEWNGFDIRLDFAAVMTEARAEKLIDKIKGRERKLRRNWVVRRYAELRRDMAA